MLSNTFCKKKKKEELTLEILYLYMLLNLNNILSISVLNCFF